jgi:tellurite resistance protein TerC
MYFLLADIAARFHLIGYGLAVIVTLVGIKMLIMDVYKVPILWMLAMVAVVLTLSIVASLLVRRSETAKENRVDRGDGG